MLEIMDNCRRIYNEINRIGVNYNQEMRLKNAEAKYKESLKRKYVSAEERLAAINEYHNVKNEINSIAFSKEEVYELLNEYRSVSERIKEIICHIQQSAE